MDSPKTQDPVTVVPDKNKAPPLEGGNSTKIGGMWISSPKFYELLINIEPKGDTALNLNNFYNHIILCLNFLNRLLEFILPDYQVVKSYSDFQEYFIQDRYQPSYSWNAPI